MGFGFELVEKLTNLMEKWEKQGFGRRTKTKKSVISKTPSNNCAEWDYCRAFHCPHQRVNEMHVVKWRIRGLGCPFLTDCIPAVFILFPLLPSQARSCTPHLLRYRVSFLLIPVRACVATNTRKTWMIRKCQRQKNSNNTIVSTMILLSLNQNIVN